MSKYDQFVRMEKEFENQEDKSIKISKIYLKQNKKPAFIAPADNLYEMYLD